MITLDERLRAADPAAELDGYPELFARKLVTGINRRPRRIKRSILLVAATLALGLMVPPALDLFRGGATAAASDLLDRAMITATDPPNRPDQYWKVTTSSITSGIIGEGEWSAPDTVSTLRRASRVAYIPVDGSRPSWYIDRLGPHVRQVSGPSTTLPRVGWSAPDVWRSAQSPRQDGQAGVLDLPREPKALRAELYRQAAGRGQSLDGEVVVIIADALRTGLAPAGVRQAMFAVLKTVPGVDIIEPRVSLNGRPGVSLGRMETVSNQRHELVFALDNGDLIGQRRVLTSFPGTPAIDEAFSRELVDRVPIDVQRTARVER